MYSIINIKDKSKDRSRAFACTKVLFIIIMCNFTDRVRVRREAPALRHRLYRQVERLSIQSSEVGPLTINGEEVAVQKENRVTL